MPLSLEVIETVSEPAGSVNDDRVGHAGSLAWVIDGATDVLPSRLLPGPSDAAWLAEAFHSAFHALAGKAGLSLRQVVEQATDRVSSAFAKAAARRPSGPEEQPSAAAAMARLSGDSIEYLTISDCQLVLAPAGRTALVLGAHPETEAGDRKALAALGAIRRDPTAKDWRSARRELLPGILAARADMNRVGGYGVLSLTLPPQEFLREGCVTVTPSSGLLLATDGFTRLCDVFRRWPVADIEGVARRRGLASLLAELRTIERTDEDCRSYPRTKPHDDASALRAEVRASE